MKTNTLTEALKDNNLVKFVTKEDCGSEVYRGFVIGLTDQFVATNDVLEWHTDGLRIYALDKLSGFVRNEAEEKSQEILKWNGVKASSHYGWLKLNSYKEIFTSLQNNCKTVVVVYDNIAVVGEIIKISNDKVSIKGFDANGVWEDELLEVSFEEITHICAEDEYSKVLRAYVDVVG